MNTINNSPNFKARTFISVSNNLLSKKEVAELTKMGEKIGFNHDTITYGVRKMNDNTFGIAQKSSFYINGNSLQTNKTHISSFKDGNAFEYIKTQLTNLKALYEDTVLRSLN